MEYQLCHNNIESLKSLGFKINWTLLKLGYQGCSLFLPTLTINDICDFATKQLELSNVFKEFVARLAFAQNDKYEFDDVLSRLTQHENICRDIQLRKWITLLVIQQLLNLPDDYTEGLLTLTELWVSMGVPDNCPHVIQGRDNTLSPNEYYTAAMYNALRQKHYNWLNEEILKIIEAEKGDTSL